MSLKYLPLCPGGTWLRRWPRRRAPPPSTGLSLSLSLSISLSLSLALSISLSRSLYLSLSLSISLSLSPSLSLSLALSLSLSVPRLKSTSLVDKSTRDPRRARPPPGAVFKAHRLVYHSTLGLTVIKKKKKGAHTLAPHRNAPVCIPLANAAAAVQGYLAHKKQHSPLGPP